jgi:hypothetical protein
MQQRNLEKCGNFDKKMPKILCYTVDVLESNWRLARDVL